MVPPGNAVRCLAWCEPKRGSGAEEYEDACAVNLARGRFAIADGATESSYAAVWARLLVQQFVAATSPEPTNWAGWLPDAQTRWEQAVGHQPLPWYAEIKWQQGAFATFLGVEVRPPTWTALAVGDSCLFHIRARQLCRAFPLTGAAAFNSSPWLIGSRGFSPEIMAVRESRCHGEFMAGDRLWLMTDALAQWFLQLAEAGQRPWEVLEPLLVLPDAATSFRAWVAALRDARHLRNDDVTLLCVWAGKAAA